jgi:hypothetical protein
MQLQKLMPANPQKSVLAIPNPIPQPGGCLWPTGERLGGSVGFSCTPISGWRQQFPLPTFALLQLLVLLQLLPLPLLLVSTLTLNWGLRREDTEYMVISGVLVVSDWKWWMKLI